MHRDVVVVVKGAWELGSVVVVVEGAWELGKTISTCYEGTAWCEFMRLLYLWLRPAYCFCYSNHNLRTCTMFVPASIFPTRIDHFHYDLILGNMHVL